MGGGGVPAAAAGVGGQRATDGGESFITVDSGSASSRSSRNIDIFIFPLNLICVMDELPLL